MRGQTGQTQKSQITALFTSLAKTINHFRQELSKLFSCRLHPILLWSYSLFRYSLHRLNSSLSMAPTRRRWTKRAKQPKISRGKRGSKPFAIDSSKSDTNCRIGSCSISVGGVRRIKTGRTLFPSRPFTRTGSTAGRSDSESSLKLFFTIYAPICTTR